MEGSAPSSPPEVPMLSALIVTAALIAQQPNAPREFVGPPDVRYSYDRPKAVKPTTTATAPAKPTKAQRYRAYQRRYEADMAAEAQAQREYNARMAPIWAAQQRRAEDMQMRMYETNLRHQENMDFNDALRGVTRPR